MIRKILAITIAVIALFAISFFAADFIYKIDKKFVQISSSPAGALIRINNKLVASDSVHLKAGNYMVSAIKTGYFESRKIVEVKNKDDKISLKLEPMPDTIVDVIPLESDSQKMEEKYPIVKKLPYEDPLYMIDYQIMGSHLNGYVPELVITADNAIGRRLALQGIRELGYDPIDYKISFLGFEGEIK